MNAQAPQIDFAGNDYPVLARDSRWLTPHTLPCNSEASARPMCITKYDADFLVDCLDEVLIQVTSKSN